MAPRRLLIFHTAFLGDVVLMLPLAQILREHFPDASIAAVTIPSAAGLLMGHPAIDQVFPYDKRGQLRGVRGMMTMAARLRTGAFDAVLIPHRSLRSALVCRLAGIPVRIGFRTSAGRLFLTETVPYAARDHEILRNIALARPLGVIANAPVLPLLYPSPADGVAVEELVRRSLSGAAGQMPVKVIAVAPGSVWDTKRWPEERYVELVRLLLDEGCSVALVGGSADMGLCGRIARGAGVAPIIDASGRLSLLQSAALIGRCGVLVTNDSAPMHLGVAMRTPVVAIFGATAPSFGFGPAGASDRVVETSGLQCRPCAIHGGRKCPIGTFECMWAITPVRVRDEVMAVLGVRT
jgi:heptosyltransferase-2